MEFEIIYLTCNLIKVTITFKLLWNTGCMSGLAVYCLDPSRCYPGIAGKHLLMPPMLLSAWCDGYCMFSPFHPMWWVPLYCLLLYLQPFDQNLGRVERTLVMTFNKYKLAYFKVKGLGYYPVVWDPISASSLAWSLNIFLNSCTASHPGWSPTYLQ